MCIRDRSVWGWVLMLVGSAGRRLHRRRGNARGWHRQRFTWGMARLARSDRPLDVVPLVRLACGAGVGLVLGLAIVWPSFLSSVLAAWAGTAAVFVAWTWAAIATMDAEETRAHATREEPTRPGSEVVLVAAAVLLSLIHISEPTRL